MLLVTQDLHAQVDCPRWSYVLLEPAGMLGHHFWRLRGGMPSSIMLASQLVGLEDLDHGETSPLALRRCGQSLRTSDGLDDVLNGRPRFCCVRSWSTGPEEVYKSRAWNRFLGDWTALHRTATVSCLTDPSGRLSLPEELRRGIREEVGKADGGGLGCCCHEPAGWCWTIEFSLHDCQIGVRTWQS